MPLYYYDYNYLKNIKFGHAWLDITDRIKDTMALSLTRNITEYWTQENANYGIKTCCLKNPDDILAWADREGLDYLLVVATGNNLSKKNNLFNDLPKYLDEIKDNLTVAGHILDKGDKFYELHHQCYLINMKWWRDAGRPMMGNENQTIGWYGNKPRRSEENWHDGYTPHWIERSDESMEYTGRRFGWNILNEALKSGKRIHSFNEIIREDKYYIYPEVEPEFHRKITDIFNSMQSYCHFVANTETPPERITDKNIEGVICTAGGITPLLCAYAANLKPYSKVSVFDISPLSIAIQRELRKTGCDYKNFKQSFEAAAGPLKLDSMFRAVSNFDRMQEIINVLMPQGLEDFIRDVWPTLEVLYFEGSLFDIYFIKGLLNRHKGQETLIHLTNILHYQNTAWLYSSTHRYRIEKDLLDIFNQAGPDNLYLYSNRPGPMTNWRLHTPRQIIERSDRFMKTTTELEVLPWIKK